MRLLELKRSYFSIRTVEHIGSVSTVPPYAILSHTWDPPVELTYQDLPTTQLYHALLLLEYTLIVALIPFLVKAAILLFWFSHDPRLSTRPYQWLFEWLEFTEHRYTILYFFGLISVWKARHRHPMLHKKAGYFKIEKTLLLARKHGLCHAWVDTCCIDKTSSAELSEAINSMYSWYTNARVCLVYLSDLDPLSAEQNLEEALAKCRWFKRGWTLQELIAPENVIFLDGSWNERGTKASLGGLLSKITGIPVQLLKGETRLEHYSVARRMSWASRRETTREEDTAYCLLGMFDVTMSLMYGEGARAFYRLQETILKETGDRSLFVWTDDDGGEEVPWSSVLAKSPRSFASAGKVEVNLTDSIYSSLSIEPRGIQLRVSLIYMPKKVDEDDAQCILDVSCSIDGVIIGIFVRKVSGGRYVRYQPWKLAEIGRGIGYYQPWQDTNRTLVETALFATKLPEEFPFFAGFNPVLGNRHSALKLRLGRSAPEFTVDQCRALPRTHWDMHDNIFICANHISKGWSAFFLHGRLADTDTTCIPVNLFLACIRWNIKQSFVILGSLDELEPATRVFLEYQLDSLEFESCRKAEIIILSVLDGKWDSSKRMVETSIVDESEMPRSNDQSALLHRRRGFQTNGPATSSADWHYRVPVGREKVRVEVSVALDEEEDRDICLNQVTTLNLRLRLLK